MESIESCVNQHDVCDTRFLRFAHSILHDFRRNCEFINILILDTHTQTPAHIQFIIKTSFILKSDESYGLYFIENKIMSGHFPFIKFLKEPSIDQLKMFDFNTINSDEYLQPSEMLQLESEHMYSMIVRSIFELRQSKEE